MWPLFLLFATTTSSPLAGFGNECIFQSVNDTNLNKLVIQSASTIQRFPGGTPSGFWNWTAGWETFRHEVDIFRPTDAAQWFNYLKQTDQETILVPNIVTSDLATELAGLKAQQQAGTNVSFVELGNEIYDHTVPQILARYPNATVYGHAMAAWVQEISAAFPHAQMALCGGVSTDWNLELLKTPVVSQVHALTRHVYTHLPEGPYNTTAQYKAVADQAGLAFFDLEYYLQVSVPSRYNVWFTEIGFYGATYSQLTWLKALTMARKLSLFASFPQTSILLPYCLVCGDPNQPSFTTPSGPYPPPPNATYTPGPWYYTPTGFGLAKLFQTLEDTASVQAFSVIPSTVNQSTSLFNNFCTLASVGVAGSVLPGSGVITSSPLACAQLCAASDDCLRWQRMDDDSKCYLKGVGSTFGSNGNSVSGVKDCGSELISPAIGVVARQQTATQTPNIFQGKIFFVNAGAEAVSLNISQEIHQPLSSLPLKWHYQLLLTDSLADVVRQGLKPTSELEIINGTVFSAGLLTIAPFSMAVLKSLSDWS
eukprot:m.72097 g.72097  ORF g.72097 m.72097 type:complete len:538 (-) comp20218_c0_seq3:32-1645(-)